MNVNLEIILIIEFFNSIFSFLLSKIEKVLKFAALCARKSV